MDVAWRFELFGAVDVCARIALSAAWLAYVFSLATDNVSTVDRLWSIVPAVYAWCAVLLSPASPAPVAERQLLIAGLCTLWACRLTFNFVRKGGYNLQMEDYRWVVVRSYCPHWLLWHLFNISFICLYQNLLLLLLVAPSLALPYIDAPAPLNWLDAVATVAFLAFLAGETVCDQQQWNFHKAKRAFQLTGSARQRFMDAQSRSVQAFIRLDTTAADVQRGFNSHGVFGVARHLNFFCEQGVWWSVFLFYVATAGMSAKCWPLALGAFLLSLLFVGSTALTERISVSKYPEYRQYQQRVSRFVPWWRRE